MTLDFSDVGQAILISSVLPSKEAYQRGEEEGLCPFRVVQSNYLNGFIYLGTRLDEIVTCKSVGITVKLLRYAKNGIQDLL